MSDIEEVGMPGCPNCPKCGVRMGYNEDVYYCSGGAEGRNCDHPYLEIHQLGDEKNG